MARGMIIPHLRSCIPTCSCTYGALRSQVTPLLERYSWNSFERISGPPSVRRIFKSKSNRAMSPQYLFVVEMRTLASWRLVG